MSKNFVSVTSSLAAVVAGLFIWVVFLQVSERSDVTQPCVFPGPRLFPEFNVTYPCYGVSENPSLEQCLQATPPPKNITCLTPQPWAPAPFRKVLILIVDGLRWNWLSWDTDFSGWHTQGMKRALKIDDRSKLCPRNAVNCFPFLHEMLKQQTHTTRLFRQICDTPTMTTQRIRSLMHGDIAPFFDISKSFAGQLRPESDSLLAQLSKYKDRPAVALGDLVWDRLFNRHLSVSVVDGCNVLADLESVDNTVHQVLWKSLEMTGANRTDLEYPVSTWAENKALGKVPAHWDFFAAHLLGSDKACHSRGTGSPLLRERLDMYDKMTANVIWYLSHGSLGRPFYSQFLPPESKWSDEMPTFSASYFGNDITNLSAKSIAMRRTDDDISQPQPPQPPPSPPSASPLDDTIFLVMGDHGMTDAGNHGGATKMEVEAGLFVYSTRHLIDPQVFVDSLNSSLASLTTDDVSAPMDPYMETQDLSSSSYYLDHGYTFRSIDQIDLTATLAFLIGVALPSGTLGNIIPELIPLYNRRYFWFDHHEKRRLLPPKTDEGDEIVAAIRCVHKEDEFWRGFVTAPILEGGSRPPAKDILDLECQLVYGEGSVGASLDHLASKSVHRDVKISKLRWMRHLRYLLHMHHQLAWNVKVSVDEIARKRPEIWTTQHLRSAWRKCEFIYNQIRGSVKASKWDQLMLLVDQFERTDSEAAAVSVMTDIEIWLRKHSKIIKGKFEETTPYICAADAGFELDREILKLESALATYRSFISHSQRAIRKSQASAFSASAAFWLAVVPLTLICGLLLLDIMLPPRRLMLAQKLYRFLRKLFWSLIAIVTLGLLKYFQPSRLSGSVVVWQIGLTIWTCILFLFKTWKDSPVLEEPEPREILEFAQRILGLIPKTCRDFNLLQEMWEFVRAGPRRNLMAFVERHFIAHFHWVFVIIHLSMSFSHGAAIDYPNLVTRVLLQDLCLWYLLKTLAIVWMKHYVHSDETLPHAKTQLKIDSLKVAGLWLGVMFLCRISDLFDPHHISPFGIPSQPLRLDIPDGVAAFITTVTALLLCALFPADQTWRAIHRAWTDCTLEGAQQQILHHLRHLLALSNKSGPEQAQEETLIAKLPSLAGFPNEQSISPDLCCSSGHGSVGTPPCITGTSPPLPPVNQRNAIPLAGVLRRVSAGLWVTQAIINSIYFSASVSAQEEIHAESITRHSHMSTYVLIAKILGVSTDYLGTLTSAKSMLIVLPRMTWLISVIHLVVVLFHVRHFRKWPEQLRDVPVIMLGWLFFLALPVHDSNGAAVMCIQSLAIPLLTLAMSQTLTVAKAGTTESQTLASSGLLMHQLFGRLDQDESKRTFALFKSEMTGIKIPSRKHPTEQPIQVETVSLISDNECVSLIYLLAFHWTLATGHRSHFNALPLNAAFVGVRDFSPVFSIVLVVIHCAAAFGAAPIFLVHLITRRPTSLQSMQRRGTSALVRLWVLMVISMLLLNVIAVYLLRNSFVAWRNYSPRYLIEAGLLASSAPFYLAMTCLVSELSF